MLQTDAVGDSDEGSVPVTVELELPDTEGEADLLTVALGQLETLKRLLRVPEPLGLRDPVPQAVDVPEEDPEALAFSPRDALTLCEVVQQEEGERVLLPVGELVEDAVPEAQLLLVEEAQKELEPDCVTLKVPDPVLHRVATALPETEPEVVAHEL